MAAVHRRNREQAQETPIAVHLAPASEPRIAQKASPEQVRLVSVDMSPAFIKDKPLLYLSLYLKSHPRPTAHAAL